MFITLYLQSQSDQYYSLPKVIFAQIMRLALPRAKKTPFTSRSLLTAYCINSWGRLSDSNFPRKLLVIPHYTLMIACARACCVVLYIRIVTASSETSGLKNQKFNHENVLQTANQGQAHVKKTLYLLQLTYKVKKKIGKAIPLQAWAGPGGFRNG